MTGASVPGRWCSRRAGGGIGRVLLACVDDNLASIRMVEASGGRLEGVIDDPAGRGRLRRYWISR